jgi:hypothetical protein
MLLLLSEKLWHPSCWLLGEAQALWSMVKMVSMEASVTLERVPDLHPVVILNSNWNKGQEVSVLMAFLELNRSYSSEMEQEAGSGRKKCRFQKNQLIGLARVFNKSKRKFVLLQNLFSSLFSKMYYFCFIYIVSFEFELTSYEWNCLADNNSHLWPISGSHAQSHAVAKRQLWLYNWNYGLWAGL